MNMVMVLFLCCMNMPLFLLRNIVVLLSLMHEYSFISFEKSSSGIVSLMHEYIFISF
jgi:hypothetical protein